METLVNFAHESHIILYGWDIYIYTHTYERVHKHDSTRWFIVGIGNSQQRSADSPRIVCRYRRDKRPAERRLQTSCPTAVLPGIIRGPIDGPSTPLHNGNIGLRVAAFVHHICGEVWASRTPNNSGPGLAEQVPGSWRQSVFLAASQFQRRVGRTQITQLNATCLGPRSSTDIKNTAKRIGRIYAFVNK